MAAIDKEIEFFGLQAALCDVWSCYPSTPPREAAELERRAARYRDLQLAAMERLYMADQRSIYTPAELANIREWCSQIAARKSEAL
jgi:hypothetical protein